MKNILLIVTGLFFTAAFMMEYEKEEILMVANKSGWNKFCDNFNQTKKFVISNKAKTIVVTTGSAGIGYATNLAIQKLNKKREIPYEWLDENKKKVGFTLTGLGMLFGFGGLIWGNAKKSQLLEQINSIKKLKEKAENKKNKLNENDIGLLSDIEKIILEIEKAKQNGAIEAFNEALFELQEQLNHC